MSNVFVVPDMHGMFENLQALLEDAGILRLSTGERIDHDTTVISIGDLGNCVRDPRRDGTENDEKCFARIGDWIDLLLIGNHEMPYWCGMDSAFSGFFFKPEVWEQLRALEQKGFIAPAVEVDGILLSHAGLGKMWGDELGCQNAHDAAAAIEARWHSSPKGGLFTAIGYRRGGYGPEGGIFWNDFDTEPKYEKFRQVIGHSVDDSVRSFGSPGSGGEGSYCIDLGSGRHGNRIAGAFIRDGEIDILEVELA